MYFDTNTKNYLANYPYRTTEVAITLFNTKASFKQLLGVEREAVRRKKTFQKRFFSWTIFSENKIGHYVY